MSRWLVLVLVLVLATAAHAARPPRRAKPAEPVRPAAPVPPIAPAIDDGPLPARVPLAFTREPGAVPPDRPAGPAVEELIRALRPYEELLTYREPALFTLDEAANRFYELWTLAHRALHRGIPDRTLAADLHAIETSAHTAARAAVQAAPNFRAYLLRTTAPAIQPEDEARTRRLVEVTRAHGEVVAALLRRALARYPQYFDDDRWGYR